MDMAQLKADALREYEEMEFYFLEAGDALSFLG